MDTPAKASWVVKRILPTLAAGLLPERSCGAGASGISKPWRADAVDHIGFVDAIFPTRDARLPIVDASIIVGVQVCANDVPVGAIAQDALGKVTHAFTAAVVFDDFRLALPVF